MATGALHVFGLEIPHAIDTLDGFRAWVSALGDAAPRVSFHRGTVHVEMTPQDFTSHEPVSTTINAALVIRARDLDLGRYFTPPSWFTSIEAGLSTEPDGFFATWESFRSGRLRVNPGRPTELLGRPDMALEVVSATSEKKDLRDLVEGYAQAGVQEYWIADARGPEARLRILALESGRYADRTGDGEGYLTSGVFGALFRLVRVSDPSGLPAFRLDIR